jgi:phosphoribosylformylglycinamidine synthase subunit PurQ / glutaminase
MAEVRALILRAAGINTDVETQYTLEMAGAKADRVHVNRLIENKSLLDNYHIMIFPGGFSYGDDVAAGKILANQMVHHLSDPMRKFIDDGKIVLGICNGFQVLIKMGVLPGDGEFKQKDLTITNNDVGCYQDRWVYLQPATDRCVLIEPQRRIYLPMAHGEGKIVTQDQVTLDRLMSQGFVAYKYVDKDGNEGSFPVNPNGSIASIAGLTDSTGRVLGLMPHPERYIHRTQHPHWTRLGPDLDPDGIKIFRNAVRYVRENLLASCPA